MYAQINRIALKQSRCFHSFAFLRNLRSSFGRNMWNIKIDFGVCVCVLIEIFHFESFFFLFFTWEMNDIFHTFAMSFTNWTKFNFVHRSVLFTLPMKWEKTEKKRKLFYLTWEFFVCSTMNERYHISVLFAFHFEIYLSQNQIGQI